MHTQIYKNQFIIYNKVFLYVFCSKNFPINWQPDIKQFLRTPEKTNLLHFKNMKYMFPNNLFRFRRQCSNVNYFAASVEDV